MDFKDLMDGYESISRDFPLPQYAISILHGKMKPAEKDAEMNDSLMEKRILWWLQLMVK
jgi:RecG-like helicase